MFKNRAFSAQLSSIIFGDDVLFIRKPGFEKIDKTVFSVNEQVNLSAWNFAVLFTALPQ